MINKNIRKAKNARYWVVGLALVLIVLFVLLRFNSAHASHNSAKATASVVLLNLAQTVEASGSLEAQPLANLKWKTSGVVDQVNVKAGDKIKAGDVLMKLKTTSVSSNIISAQADLVNAQKELENVQNSGTDLAQAVIDLKAAQEAYDKADHYLKYLTTDPKVPQTMYTAKLVETRNGWRYDYQTDNFKGPAPEDWIADAENDLALKKAQLDDAQRTYDQLKEGLNSQDVIAAQAKVDAAQATVDSMSIIAPFDGEVLYVESRPGDIVDTDTFAVNVANLDQLYVEMQVDESDIANVKMRDQVTATLDAVPGVTLTGKVTAINPVGEVVSGLVKYTVRVDLDKADKNLALPLGATVNATIQVKDPTAMLAVPVTAIQNDSKGEYVWVVRNGSPVRVDVVGGQIVSDHVAVTGNLKEGELVQLGQGNNSPAKGPFRMFSGHGG